MTDENVYKMPTKFSLSSLTQNSSPITILPSQRTTCFTFSFDYLQIFMKDMTHADMKGTIESIHFTKTGFEVRGMDLSICGQHDDVPMPRQYVNDEIGELVNQESPA